MDQNVPAPDPVPASQAQPAPQVVVNCGASPFRRLFGWLGWIGFALCLLILISQSVALRQYFNRSEGVRERYYSGGRYVRDKVAIISVTGTILDGEHVRRQINRARDDDNVKAVVVRIVSPGGTIAGSDYIHHHLRKLREEKEIPLVVSMGGIAASGGYYVAMAVGEQERSIFAEPTTTTGSIGVMIPHYDISGLLQRFEIEDRTLSTHPNKRMLSMTRPMTDDQREILEAYLNSAMDRFKDIILQGRPVFREDPAALDQLATGEIFTAGQAKKHGLIDEIGFLEAAIERALELAGLDEDKTRVVEYHRPPSLFDLPWTTSSRLSPGMQDLAALFDGTAPRAYYLASTLPPLMSR